MEVYKGDERCQQTLTVMLCYEYLMLNREYPKECQRFPRNSRNFKTRKIKHEIKRCRRSLTEVSNVSTNSIWSNSGFAVEWCANCLQAASVLTLVFDHVDMLRQSLRMYVMCTTNSNAAADHTVSQRSNFFIIHSTPFKIGLNGKLEIV